MAASGSGGDGHDCLGPRLRRPLEPKQDQRRDPAAVLPTEAQHPAPDHDRVLEAGLLRVVGAALHQLGTALELLAEFRHRDELPERPAQRGPPLETSDTLRLERILQEELEPEHERLAGEVPAREVRPCEHHADHRAEVRHHHRSRVPAQVAHRAVKDEGGDVRCAIHLPVRQGVDVRRLVVVPVLSPAVALRQRGVPVRQPQHDPGGGFIQLRAILASQIGSQLMLLDQLRSPALG